MLEALRTGVCEAEIDQQDVRAHHMARQATEIEAHKNTAIVSVEEEWHDMKSPSYAADDTPPHVDGCQGQIRTHDCCRRWCNMQATIGAATEASLNSQIREWWTKRTVGDPGFSRNGVILRSERATRIQRIGARERCALPSATCVMDFTSTFAETRREPRRIGQSAMIANERHL